MPVVWKDFIYQIVIRQASNPLIEPNQFNPPVHQFSSCSRNNRSQLTQIKRNFSTNAFTWANESLPACSKILPSLSVAQSIAWMHIGHWLLQRLQLALSPIIEINTYQSLEWFCRRSCAIPFGSNPDIIWCLLVRHSRSPTRLSCRLCWRANNDWGCCCYFNAYPNDSLPRCTWIGIFEKARRYLQLTFFNPVSAYIGHTKLKGNF